MSPLLSFAQAFFVIGGLLLIMLCLVLVRRHPSPFLRAYTSGFGCTFLMEVAEALRPALTDTRGPATFIALLLTLAAACFASAAERLAERPEAPWLRPVAVALAVLVLALGVWGAPPNTIVMVGGTPMTLALIRLGVTFWRLQTSAAPRGSRWLGATLITLALWPFIVPYPLLRDTPWAWVGFMGSGFLQAAMGTGLVAHLLDDAWARFRAEQARLDRLKSEFVSMVSHELRTPLTSIVGYAEFLEDGIGGPLGPDQLAYVQQIQANGQRLQRLVEDLLDFSSLDGRGLKLAPRDVDLVAVVRDAVAGFAPQAREAGITLAAHLPAGPVPTVTDPLRLAQAVANLVGNALKFTPRGGRIDVTMGVMNVSATLEVADTGIGIAPEELPRIFDKFYQVEATLTRLREGAGLGLAITRAIADALDAHLDVESEPGRGSRFRLTLPLTGSRPAAVRLST